MVVYKATNPEISPEVLRNVNKNIRKNCSNKGNEAPFTSVSHTLQIWTTFFIFGLFGEGKRVRHLRLYGHTSLNLTAPMTAYKAALTS